MFAPRYNPSHLFYKKGLRGFLAACGVRVTSATTVSQNTMVAEGGAEGPRRVVFDLENISEHEKAAGAKSEGLTIGPCSDYNGSKPTLLCDLEIVLLVLMRLRTSEVRELQAIMSHQGLVVMGAYRHYSVSERSYKHFYKHCFPI